VLYHLLAPLGKKYILFNLFNYITFRAAGATVTALIPRLRRRALDHRETASPQVGQIIRAEGPASHQGKRGTPRWAASSLFSRRSCRTLLWARLDTRYVVVAVVATLWMGPSASSMTI